MYSQDFELVNKIFKAAHGCAAAMGATINSPSNETEPDLVLGFAPPFQSNNLQKPALHITAAGLRTRSEGAAIAQASAVTAAEGWAQGQTREGTGGCASDSQQPP